MGWKQAGLYGLVSLASLSDAVLFNPKNVFQPTSWKNSSFPVDIKPHFDNRAFGMKPNDADFDGSGSELRTWIQ